MAVTPVGAEGFVAILACDVLPLDSDTVHLITAPAHALPANAAAAATATKATRRCGLRRATSTGTVRTPGAAGRRAQLVHRSVNGLEPGVPAPPPVAVIPVSEGILT